MSYPNMQPDPQTPEQPQNSTTPTHPTEAYPTTEYPTASFAADQHPTEQYPAQQSTQGFAQPVRSEAPVAQYPAAPHQPPPTTLGATNTFALLAIIMAFLSPIAGIVFGHMGLSQIKRNGDGGRGIALTGLIISYAYFVFLALFIILYVGFILMLIGTAGAAFSELGSYSDYSDY